MPLRFEINELSAGEWRWRLAGDDNRTFAKSPESYPSRVHCACAIEVFKVAVDHAAVPEQDLSQPAKPTSTEPQADQ